MPVGVWLPVDRVRACRVSQVVGPAIVLPVEQYDLPFLVVGRGDEAVACIVGEQYPFEGMSVEEAGNHKGLAVEGVEFELDLSTVYSAEARFTSVLGSLVRSETRLE